MRSDLRKPGYLSELVKRRVIVSEYAGRPFSQQNLPACYA
jgi:hypothetical protein